MNLPEQPSHPNHSQSFYAVVRLRLYPTSFQQQRLFSWLEALRWLYNFCLAWRKSSYQEHNKPVSHRQQRDALPQLKKQHPHLKSPPSASVQDCLARLQGAFDRFFQRIQDKRNGAATKAGYPRFKRYGEYRSLTYPQVWMTQNKDGRKVIKEVLKLERGADEGWSEDEASFVSRMGTLALPKLGVVKVRLHRYLPWEKAKTVTLKQTRGGDWYACVCFVVEATTNKGEASVGGVDVGLKNLLTTSDGEQFAHPKVLEQSKDRLRKEQRKLSGKQKGSENWEKQRKKVAKLHEKIANQRKDFLHKVSLWLVKAYSLIVFEDLDILGMVKDRRFAKSILDAGWGRLITLTTYKSVKLGGRVVKVDPRYTSQDCSECGKRVPKTLAERMHECPGCGLVMDRDENAARNIKKRIGIGLGQSESSQGRDCENTLVEREPLWSGS